MISYWHLEASDQSPSNSRHGRNPVMRSTLVSQNYAIGLWKFLSKTCHNLLVSVDTDLPGSMFYDVLNDQWWQFSECNTSVVHADNLPCYAPCSLSRCQARVHDELFSCKLVVGGGGISWKHFGNAENFSIIAGARDSLVKHSQYVSLSISQLARITLVKMLRDQVKRVCCKLNAILTGDIS